MIGGHKVLDVLRALTPPRAESCDVEAAEQGAPMEHGEVEDAATFAEKWNRVVGYLNTTISLLMFTR